MLRLRERVLALDAPIQSRLAVATSSGVRIYAQDRLGTYRVDTWIPVRNRVTSVSFSSNDRLWVAECAEPPGDCEVVKWNLARPEQATHLWSSKKLEHFDVTADGVVVAYVGESPASRAWNSSTDAQYDELPVAHELVPAIRGPSSCPIKVAVASATVTLIDLEDTSGDLVEQIDAKGVVGQASISPDCTAVFATVTHGDPEFLQEQAFSVTRWVINADSLTHAGEEWLAKYSSSEN